MKAMREELKAVERLRKAADQLARQERDKPRDRGAGAVKGTVFCRPLLGASRFTTPFCTELSTFTHGRRLPYEADYFTRHCPPEYPPAPCPLAAEPADAPTGPEPEAHACHSCGNCGGVREVPA